MTSAASQAVVQRLWNCCALLRDVGLAELDRLTRCIVEDLRVALAQFAAIADNLGAADALDLADEE
jgi:hypothetical protein